MRFCDISTAAQAQCQVHNEATMPVDDGLALLTHPDNCCGRGLVLLADVGAKCMGR